VALLAADPVSPRWKSSHGWRDVCRDESANFYGPLTPGSQAAQERSIEASVVIDDTSDAERVERQFDQFAKAGVLCATRAESRSRAVNDS